MAKVKNIFQQLLRSVSTPTARTATIFYFGSFALSIFRYFFHLVLMRFLVPAQYGEFLSYLSLIYLLSIPTITIGNVVTKYVAEFKGRGDKISVNLFFHHLLKQVTPVAFAISTLLILFASPLASLFKANTLAIIVLSLSFFVSLYQTIVISYISAFQKFVFQTVSSFIGVLTTIAISIFLIKLGFGATGAVIGQILGGVINTIMVFFVVKPQVLPISMSKTKPKFSLKGLLGYSFIYALGTMSLISVDILVVRVLFEPHLSGIYSSLSILGRMILFGLTPIIALVLPIASHRHSRQGGSTTVFLKLGGALLLLGLFGAGIFSAFPVFIIKTLSGSAYLDATPFLSAYAFSMIFFAFSQFVLSYLMAVGRPAANKLLLLATIIQPLALYLSRSSIAAVVWSNFALHCLLAISLTIYYIKAKSDLSHN